MGPKTARKGLAGVAALAASIAMLASAPAAQGAFQWSEGPIERSYITNCPSIIFGSPYTEEGAWTWTGQYLDPADFPNVNSTFYIHVVAGAVGNSCSGQYVHFELNPTSGMTTAVTPTTPIFCYAINWNTNPPSAQQEPTFPAGACPVAPEGGGYGYGPSFDAQTSPTTAEPWPLPQGRGWEIQVPVQSNRVMNGGFGACMDCAGFATKLFDGNSSPLLFPRQGMFVDNAGAGGSTPGAGGGTSVGLRPNAQRPAPAPPATTATPPAQQPKKCKKGQKLRKGKCVKKKKKKK